MDCPLTGKPCNYLRVYRVTELKNNQITREMDLCERCCKDYKENPEQFDKKEIKVISLEPDKVEVKIITSVDELMQLLGVDLPPPEPEKEPCPGCGMTMAEFNRVGKFGCAECYRHYLEEFVALAGPFHGTDGTHVGKTPKNFYTSDDPLADQLKDLKLRLTHCVEHEKYEDAAALKICIQELESLIKKQDEAI